MKKGEHFNESLSSILALVGVVLSVISLVISQNANNTAIRANEIAYESLLTERTQYTPILSCEYKSSFDSENMEIDLYNSGGVIQQLKIMIHSFWEIDCEDEGKDSHFILLPVTQSPISMTCTISSPECFANIILPFCNTSKVLSIIKDYETEAYRRTGANWYRPSYLNLIEINYTDALGRTYEELYCFDGFSIQEGASCLKYENLIDACDAWCSSSLHDGYQGTHYSGFNSLEFENMNGKLLFEIVSKEMQENNWKPYIPKVD